jgi:hypothetical protein
VKLDDKLEGLGLLSNDTVGRERRTLRARYQLVDAQSGEVLLDATAGSDAGLDVVSPRICHRGRRADRAGKPDARGGGPDRYQSGGKAAAARQNAAMKATQRDFASVAPRAVKQAHVFFLCGTDDASVQDAAHRIAGLLPDPGERVEFSGAELKRDPVRLGDEARSTSLFGDARHIWVRCSGDEAHDAVEILIGGDVPPCPVIIQAANASDKSRTAKLLEKRDDALVAMFYPPDLPR